MYNSPLQSHRWEDGFFKKSSRRRAVGIRLIACATYDVIGSAHAPYAHAANPEVIVKLSSDLKVSSVVLHVTTVEFNITSLHFVFPVCFRYCNIFPSVEVKVSSKVVFFVIDIELSSFHYLLSSVFVFAQLCKGITYLRI